MVNPSDREPLTPIQAKVYDYMVSYFGINDQLPPTRTIQDAFGWQSQTAAMQHVAKIKNRGWLEKNEVRKYKLVRPILYNGAHDLEDTSTGHP